MRLVGRQPLASGSLPPTTRKGIAATWWLSRMPTGSTRPRRRQRLHRPPPRRSPVGVSLLQGEHEEGASCWKVGHLGPERRIESENERPQSARHRDVLLAVDGVADGPAPVARTRSEVPELLAGVTVVSTDHTLDVAVDDKPTTGREHAPDWWVLEVDRPLPLTGHRVARIQVTIRLPAGGMLGDLIAAEEEASGRLQNGRLFLDRHFLAHFHRRVVPETGLRV